MDGNEPEVDDINNNENLPAEQSSREVSNASEIINKKIQERLSKSATKNVAKQTLAKALMPILTWVAVIIIIIIVLIGIIMFFITMPGMAMDQLKQFGKQIANTFSAFFGGDKTTQVGDEEIYDVLTYLEQMSYDLKGYGFLTDYLDTSNYLDDVAESKKDEAYLDEKIGVVRDSNDQIINAESDFIFTYLVSDNYVYTIANYNQTSEDGTEDYTGLTGALRRIAVGAQAVWRKIENIVCNDGYKWGKGLIHIYYEEDNTVGELGNYLGSSIKDGTLKWVGAKINASSDPPTLEIRRGWGANTMKYSLDGWTGRYGMPLEFLLSMHLATYMPDLAYDMVKSFDTKIEILFRDVGGTAVGAYKIGNRYVSYDEIHEIAKDFIGDGISSTEAKTIMDKFSIPSPDNCKYYEELAKQDVSKSEGAELYSDGIQDLTTYLEDTLSSYDKLMTELKELGYSEGTLPTTINADTFDSLLKNIEIGDPIEDSVKKYYQDSIAMETYALAEYKINKENTITCTWTNPSDKCQYTIELYLYHTKFYGVPLSIVNDFESAYSQQNYKDFKEYCESTENNLREYSKLTYKITKSASQDQLDQAGVKDESQLKCSNSDVKKCCNACTQYIQDIYDLVKDADVGEYNTYQPYISKVTNHWYRDVYFVKGDKDFVQYDYDYESVMKERWTLYETYTNKQSDGYKYNPDKEGEIILFEIDENGDFKKDSNGDYIIYDGTMEDANPSILYEKVGDNYNEYKGSTDNIDDVELYRKKSDGTFVKYTGKVAVAKKPVLISSSDEEILKDLNWIENDGVWSAYEVSNAATVVDYSPAYEQSGDTDNQTDKDKMKQNIYAKVITYGNVVQKGEGQRTETNPIIKRMFLQNKYLRYESGNHTRAEIVNKLRKAVDDGNDGNYYGVIQGINANNESVDYSETSVEIDGETYYAKDYMGQVNIDQDSLNAFSMLENTHTLDADYIYRDFKELIVELGYFEKEELTDETPRIMQWLIPEIGSAAGDGDDVSSSEIGERIVEAAERVYKYGTEHNYTYYNSSSTVGIMDINDSTGGVKKTMCSGFVASVLVEAGVYERKAFTLESGKTWAPYALEFWWFGEKGFGSKNKTNENGQTVFDYMCDKFEDMELVQDTSKDGKEIDFSKLEPGDIIVSKHKLNNDSDVTGHVAIYAGDGKIYHSTGGNGNPGVHYSNIEGAGGEGGWTRAIRVTGSSGDGSSGSAGWPYRKLDKREYKAGTMIHSKGDMDVAKTQALKNAIAQAVKTEQPDDVVGDGSAQNKGNTNLATVSGVTDTDNELSIQSTVNVTKSVSGIKSNIERIAESGDGYEYKVKNGNVEYTHYYQFQGSYKDNPFRDETIASCGCGPTSCCNLLTGYGNDITPADTAGFLKTLNSDADLATCLEHWGVTAQWIVGKTKDEYKSLMEEAISEGKPLIALVSAATGGDDFWTSRAHFVMIVGIDTEGNLVTCDPGAGSAKPLRHCNPDGLDSIVGYMDGLLIPDEAPNGARKGNGEEYKGYLGNEAVVSPVTGILLEYGTYKGQKSSNSDEEYRTNLDLKYGTNLFDTTNENDKKIQVDHVGYAKILILDKANYEKLEAAIIGKTRWKTSFLTSKGKFRNISSLSEEIVNDANSPWSDIDKTLYGYKEFAELYEEYGIAGTTVYIDGFKCELPDEEFDVEKDGDEEIPDGEDLKLSTFKNAVNGKSFDSDGNIIDEDSLMESLYEIDEEYNLPSKKATEKLNTESQIKEDAVSTFSIDDLVFIKEGTVIGRTITDRELIVEYRKEKYEDYRGKDETQDNDKTKDNDVSGDKIIGNYIKILMTEPDKSVIENVEDYMKLDDGEEEKTQADHFSVVGTVLSKQEWVEKALAYTANHGDATFKNRANLEELFDICEEKGVNPEFIFVRAIQECGLSSENGNNYWGYNTPNGQTTLWDGGTWQHVLELYCDTILEYQDPASSYYNSIMNRYNERVACTENGGIDPYGYGLPSSVSGIQSIYSWLGDDHLANSSGDGGMYYLYPWGWGGVQYEGENKIIFESKSEFEQLCGSKHGTSGGSTSPTKTTVWEQGMYTAWQSKKIIEPAKEIFGELAGTHDP